MKKVKYLITLMCFGFAFSAFAQQPFTAGNIVVYRMGDGTVVLSNVWTKIFLDEYTPSGTLVQSIEMPSTDQKLTHAGSNSYQSGLLTLSSNGRYLVVPGYPGDLGMAANVGVGRSIGLVNYDGTLASVTTLTNPDFWTMDAAASDNGVNLWFVGSDGIEYTTSGSTDVTKIVNTEFAEFSYGINIADGQLYASTDGSPAISRVGTGLPTAEGETFSGLPGLDNLYLSTQFAFADLNPNVPGVDVLYVTSQNLNAGGLNKYSLVNNTWVLNGSIGVKADRYVGLTIKTSGNNVTLFATRKGTNSDGNLGGPAILGGDLVTLTDNSGYNGTFISSPTIIADIATRFGAANVAAFRGVALVPQGPSVKVSAKAFLQGAYNTTVSRHKDVTTTWAAVLNANALNQPYNTTAFGNYNGGEHVSAGFFTSTGATTDILDWVLVELRNSVTPATVVAKKAAFIREDGQIVDVDGTSPVNFPNTNAGNYYVVVRHRNHLSVRSANAVALSSTITSYDFTTAQSKAFQNGSISNTAMATKDLLGATPGVFMMWGGNANSDNLVRASAGSTVNDYLTLMSPTNLNGNTSTILSNVYRSVDMNLDGTVRASAGSTVNDYLVLMSPGILNGNTSTILSAHQ